MVFALLLSMIFSAEFKAQSDPGAVMAPAALPNGALALYGWVGAPSVGAGYRQGLLGIELEAKASLHIFTLSALLEGGAKLAIFRGEQLILAPGIALGVQFNSGTQYFDRTNFGFWGLRPRGSFNASYAFSKFIAGVAQCEIPVTLPLTVRGIQVTPTMGLGTEIHIGEQLSVLGTAHVGVDVLKNPSGELRTRIAWEIRLGIGQRLF